MPEKTGNGNDKWMDVHSEVSNIKRKIYLVARSLNFFRNFETRFEYVNFYFADHETSHIIEFVLSNLNIFWLNLPT